MKKVLTLDYQKWRCGLDDLNKLGEGSTALLNDEGYMWLSLVNSPFN
jgi:hypothetical protein